MEGEVVELSAWLDAAAVAAEVTSRGDEPEPAPASAPAPGVLELRRILPIKVSSGPRDVTSWCCMRAGANVGTGRTHANMLIVDGNLSVVVGFRRREGKQVKKIQSVSDYLRKKKKVLECLARMGVE